MLETLTHLFGSVCGQNPEHTWAPGGILLPCCQRCLGLYAGAFLAALLHYSLKPRLTGRFLEVHGAFLLLMAPCGLHWLPQGSVLRTISGLLFGFGVVTFIWLSLAARFVAQVSEPAVSPTSKAAGLPTAPHSWSISRPPGLEPCATSQAQPAPGPSAASGAAAYAVTLAATFVLVPLLAGLGGKVTAYGLAGLTLSGAAVLGVLVIVNLSLGVAGVIRFVRRLVLVRTRA